MQPQTSVSQQAARITPGLDSTTPMGWRHALWLTILVAASVAFSFGFACAVPFAAFGAIVALTLERREGLFLTIALWLANQIVGFSVLGYPRTASTFVWGLVLGIVAVLATIVAQSITQRLDSHRGVVVVPAAFAGAFFAYESSLFVVSAVLVGGTENFIPEIVVRILEVNAAAFAGLLVLNRVASIVGLAARQAFP
jgi:hypothetical protein